MRQRARATLAIVGALAAISSVTGGIAPSSAATDPAGEVSEVVAMVDTNGDAPGGLHVSTIAVGDRREGELVAAELRALPAVVAVDVGNPVYKVAAVDPLRSSQWALTTLQAEGAQSYATGNGVVVAVVDSGVQASHPDLQGAVLPGIDLTGNGNPQLDELGHGTHVAGIIAATMNNGIGVGSLAPDVSILPVRVGRFDLDGVPASMLAEGINWAAANGADVINLSLQGTTYSAAVDAAVQSAIGQGIVVVAAAGNKALNGNPVIYPAALAGVIGVGATTSGNARADYSSVGNWVDVVAPGGHEPAGSATEIISTCAGTFNQRGTGLPGYCTLSGTSMATGYASALAAMIRQRWPFATPTEVADILASSADDLGSPGYDTSYGAGLIDPIGALSTDWFPQGYRMTATNGNVFAFGSAAFYGSPAGALARPVVGMASTASGNGYWLVASDGGIFAYGDAPFYGSTGNIALNKPIVGMTPTPSGRGYWFVASDGGIFAYGDAAFYGSTGAMVLNKPIVGMARTPSGGGYWLVASDGGIFAYGDAAFYGSTGAIVLNKPIVGMAPTADGQGYWFVASDGGIFAYGNAVFYGSTGGFPLASPIVGMAASPSGGGYWFVTAAGGIFNFGDAQHLGSPGFVNPATPVVGMASR